MQYPSGRGRGCPPPHVIETPPVVLVELFAAAEERVLDPAVEYLVAAIPIGRVSRLSVDPSVSGGDEQIQVRCGDGRVTAIVPERLLAGQPSMLPQPIHRHLDCRLNPRILRPVVVGN